MIHLQHSECAAVEESDSKWKISAGFSDCGTEIRFVDNKLAVDNQLMIGSAIIDGFRLTNGHEIGFTCKYNNVATVSKSFNAHAESVVFDINDEAPAELSFGFKLQPYESDDYTTAADLSTGSALIGSSMYLRVSPENELPESLTFSVHKCSVEDEEIDTRITILDSCPLFPGLNFKFKTEQSDQKAVDFSFTSFLFPSSAERAMIKLTCDINICPLNSAECLKRCSTTTEEPATKTIKTTTTTTPTTTTPVNYATVAFSQFVDVQSDYSQIDRRLSTSYLSDGSRKTQLFMKTPDAKVLGGLFYGYLHRTGFTMLNGEYYVFGGYDTSTNIFKFNGCALEQLEVTMPTQDYVADDGAVVRTVVHADGSENAYICFTNNGSGSNKKCDSFDGTTAVSQPYVSSAISRQTSSMANYNGGLLVFGGYGYKSDTGSIRIRDTEIFTPGVGFSAAAPMIYGAFGMSSLTIETDRVIMFGGYIEDGGITDKIFMYYNDEWSFVGNMVEANWLTTAIMIGSSIIVSSGHNSGVIQQFEWDGSTISEGRIVDDVGDFKQLRNPIVIPELFEECERPTNEFIFGAPLGETTGDYHFTALDFSLASLDYSETTPDYFEGVIYDMDSYRFYPGVVNYWGQIYMIGGYDQLRTKIFKFTGSTTEEVALSGDQYKGYQRDNGNNPVVGWQDYQERIFLCFSYDWNACQTFDGSVIRNVEAETEYAHYPGCVGTFEKNKEVVAIGGSSAGKVEIFDGTSWRDGPDHPNNLVLDAVSVDVGAGIITIGGNGDINGYSAYLLTYDDINENTKKWVDLGRLNSRYAGFSAFRFGEIIVAHQTSKPGAGIYMLTWDGENLEDHGIQIDLDLYGGSGGVFIPKEDTSNA